MDTFRFGVSGVSMAMLLCMQPPWKKTIAPSRRLLSGLRAEVSRCEDGKMATRMGAFE